MRKRWRGPVVKPFVRGTLLFWLSPTLWEQITSTNEVEVDNSYSRETASLDWRVLRLWGTIDVNRLTKSSLFLWEKRLFHEKVICMFVHSRIVHFASTKLWKTWTAAGRREGKDHLVLSVRRRRVLNDDCAEAKAEVLHPKVQCGNEHK